MQYVDVQLARRLCPFVTSKPSKDADDIVEFGVRQKVRKVGDGENDYVIEDEVYEVSRVNRQAWIAKDAPDVGVLNILEKVRRSGDYSLLNQTHSIIPDGLQDYTNAPGSVSEALEAVKAGVASYGQLKEIVGDLTFEAMANLSPEQLQEAIQNYVAAQGGQKGND